MGRCEEMWGSVRRCDEVEEMWEGVRCDEV